MKLFKTFFLSALAFGIMRMAEDAPAADSATVTTDVQQTGTEALETAQASVDSEIAAASPNVDGGATADSTIAADTASTADAGNVSVEDVEQASTSSTTADSTEPEDVVGGLVASLEAEINALGTALTADLRAVWDELKAAL